MKILFSFFMKNILLFLLVTSMLWLSSCDSPPAKGQETQVALQETEKLNVFLDSVFDAAVSRAPQWESRLGIRTNYGKWDDQSDAAQLAEIRFRSAELAALQKRVDFEALDPQGKLSYRLFEEKVRRMEAREPYIYHSYPVEQMHGIQSEIPSFLINIHRVDSLPDAEAYVQRLEGIPQVMRQVVEQLELRAEKDILIPKFVFPLVLRDCRNILSGAPFEDDGEPSVLLKDFDEKIAGLELPEVERAALRELALAALRDSVGAGYEGLIACLERLEKQSDERDGAWKFPDGAAFYDYALQRTTTTDMTAAEIHALGLAEVARIHGEMRAIMARVGFEGDLQAFFAFMRTAPQFYYPNDEAGRQRYLDEATALVDSMRTLLPDYFGTLPAAEMVVKRVEAYRERSAGKAFYNQPAPDGSRPGIYYANLYNMADMPTYQMEALAFHEGIPGHHMQLSIAQELEGLAKFRRYTRYTSYIEGWGLYSEYLAKEMGFYTDPYSDFGRLAMELWRACRLVVDTGIHSKRWTREEAIEYLKENTPNPEGDIVKAIERYIVMPSQATAYKIGMIKIQELRAKAEEKLGEGFKVGEFHDVVLTNGAVPLNLLEELVDAYIAEALEPTPES